MPQASILVPIDLARRGSSLGERITRLARATQGTEFSLILGHADRALRQDEKLKAQMESFSHVRVISDHVKNPHTNMARLRNLALHETEGEYVLLLDADIHPDLDLFRAMLAQIEAGTALSMAPCLYLSREGTRALMRGKLDKTQLVEKSLAFSPKFTLHWAIPSSVIAMTRRDYLAIEGFHEGYEGHGYEDLDFMLRLALSKNVIEPSASLLIDQTYRAPLLAEGFRGVVGQLCIPNLLDDHVALHLFHDRDNNEAYYRQRKQNARLFHDRMKELLGNATESTDPVPETVSRFYAECLKRNIDPARYQALFDARPRHLIRRRPFYSRWWRKFRKWKTELSTS